MTIHIPEWFLWGTAVIAGGIAAVVIFALAYIGLQFLRHYKPPRW